MLNDLLENENNSIKSKDSNLLMIKAENLNSNLKNILYLKSIYLNIYF